MTPTPSYGSYMPAQDDPKGPSQVWDTVSTWSKKWSNIVDLATLPVACVAYASTAHSSFSVSPYSSFLDFLEVFPFFVHPSVEDIAKKGPQPFTVACLVATNTNLIRDPNFKSKKERSLHMCRMPWGPNYYVGSADTLSKWKNKKLLLGSVDVEKVYAGAYSWVSLSTMWAQCIPGLDTYASQLQAGIVSGGQGAFSSLFLDAAVLSPPDSSKKRSEQQVRIAVADFTPNSVLCWAPTKVTLASGSTADTLVMALLKGPLEEAFKDEGSLIEDLVRPGVPDKNLNPPKTYRTKLVAQPVGQVSAVPQVDVPDQNCVLGPSNWRVKGLPMDQQDKLTVLAVWHDQGGEPVQPAGWRLFVQIHHVGTQPNLLPSNTPQDYNALVGAVQIWPLGYNHPHEAGKKVTTIQQALGIPKGRESYNNPDYDSLVPVAATAANASTFATGQFSIRMPRFSSLREIVDIFRASGNSLEIRAAYDSKGENLVPKSS